MAQTLTQNTPQNTKANMDHILAQNKSQNAEEKMTQNTAQNIDS